MPLIDRLLLLEVAGSTLTTSLYHTRSPSQLGVHLIDCNIGSHTSSRSMIQLLALPNIRGIMFATSR